MIITLVLYVFVMFINIITTILPDWQVWPSALLDAFTYFLGVIATLNFILPIDTLFTVLVVAITFESTYLVAKIITKVFNFFRGTGSGLDL